MGIEPKYVVFLLMGALSGFLFSEGIYAAPSPVLDQDHPTLIHETDVRES